MSSFQTFPLSWCYFSIRLLSWSRWCHHYHVYAVGVVAIPFHTDFTKKRQTGNEKDTEKDRERQSKERQREIKFGCRKKWRLTKVQQSVRQTERNSLTGKAKRQRKKKPTVSCSKESHCRRITANLGLSKVSNRICPLSAFTTAKKLSPQSEVTSRMQRDWRHTSKRMKWHAKDLLSHANGMTSHVKGMTSRTTELTFTCRDENWSDATCERDEIARRGIRQRAREANI